MSVAKIIIILSHIPVFAVTLYALFIYKSLKSDLRVFAAFLFCTGILQLIGFILWFIPANNLFVLHAYVPIGFLFLIGFYRIVFKDFLNKRVLPIVGIGFLFFSVINTIFFQDLFTFNSNAQTVESILLLILSLSTYMLFLNKTVIKQDQQTIRSLNWINSGVFIYYASTLLIFYFGEFITKNVSVELSRNTWVVITFFSVIMYGCFFKGLWNRAKK